jgi:cytochrome c553
MKRFAAVLALSFAPLAMAYAADEFPSWAFPVNRPEAPGAAAPKDEGALLHVPDSNVAMTRTEIAGRDAVPDWHPEDHPEMPPVVKNGRQGVRACAYCHQPTGVGRPENAALAGLNEDYIKRQVANFKLGNRKGSEPKRVPQSLMAALAANVTDEEIAEAAKYFASLEPVSFVRVVETDMVPKTFVTGGMLAKFPEGGMEPIGNRIIEIPEDLERAENRDSRTPFIAYVPKGALAKGEGHVAGMGCASCHGANLLGSGDVPRIAGHSPSYIVRQLWDMQHGKRSGGIAPMQTVVANMDLEDMIAIAAYVATRGQ